MQVRRILGTSAMAASSSPGWATPALAADIRDEHRQRRRREDHLSGPDRAGRSRRPGVGRPPHLSRRRSQAFFRWAKATRLPR
jgi:hypothetical protein